PDPGREREPSHGERPRQQHGPDHVLGELHGPDDDGHPLGHDRHHGSEHPRELHAQRHGAELPNGDEPTNRRQRHRDRYRHLRRLSGVAKWRAEQLHGERSEPPHGDGARQWDGPDHVLGELHGPDDDPPPRSPDLHHGPEHPRELHAQRHGAELPNGDEPTNRRQRNRNRYRP